MVLEIRIPQHGPLTTTAPEREELEAPINNLIERKFGFIHRFRNPELSNQDGNSRSTSVAVEAAGSLEDVVLRKPDLVQEKDRLLVLQQWEGIIIEVYFDVL